MITLWAGSKLQIRTNIACVNVFAYHVHISIQYLQHTQHLYIHTYIHTYIHIYTHVFLMRQNSVDRKSDAADISPGHGSVCSHASFLYVYDMNNLFFLLVS